MTPCKKIKAKVGMHLILECDLVNSSFDSNVSRCHVIITDQANEENYSKGNLHNAHVCFCIGLNLI